jgi:hypothetical protein
MIAGAEELACRVMRHRISAKDRTGCHRPGCAEIECLERWLRVKASTPSVSKLKVPRAPDHVRWQDDSLRVRDVPALFIRAAASIALT